MLTQIGDFLRSLRMENGELLKTMAEKLEVSSAFLSAVENEKKKMPASWEEKLSVIYHLSQQQIFNFQEAIADTNQAIELNLENTSSPNRELALSFARHFDSLDEETSKRIMEMLQKHGGDK